MHDNKSNNKIRQLCKQKNGEVWAPLRKRKQKLSRTGEMARIAGLEPTHHGFGDRLTLLCESALQTYTKKTKPPNFGEK
jgi:hypothetical protein